MSSASSSPLRLGRIERAAPQGSRRSCHVLRFASFLNASRSYAFPCDAAGHVDIDSLDESTRLNYFYARTVIGREFRAPVTCMVTAVADAA